MCSRVKTPDHTLEKFCDTENYGKIKLRGQRDIPVEEQLRILEEIGRGQSTAVYLSDKYHVKLAVIYRMTADHKKGEQAV